MFKSLIVHQSRQFSAITAELAAALPHTSVVALDQVEALSFPGTASGERWASVTAPKIDEDRWCMKAAIGFVGTVIPRQDAFCNITITEARHFVIEDTLDDLRFSDGPIVTGPRSGEVLRRLPDRECRRSPMAHTA